MRSNGADPDPGGNDDPGHADALLELGLDMPDLPFEGAALEAVRTDPAYERRSW